MWQEVVGGNSMNTHELALKTYADLQKRKEARKQKERDINSLVIENVLRVRKNKYRQYWSRGI
jgi:hypothetical protein